MNSLFKDQHPKAVYLFFTAYLLLGLFIFKDYGISFDEYFQWDLGQKSLAFVTNHNQELLSHRDKHYGPAFEMVLSLAERLVGCFSYEIKDVFLMRHCLTFLLFYLGTIFFYLLCKERFQSWKMGLLGVLFLILSPRIFADSFYNSKDIAVLAVFIISIYTLSRFLKENTYSMAFIHAVVSAFLIDIRIVGLMVPALTLIAWGRVYLKNFSRHSLFTLCTYGAGLIIFTVLFWPFLWSNPITNFMDSLKFMAHFPRLTEVLYLGQYWDNRSLPWHYLPVWILITTPIIYLVLFLIGLAVSFFKDLRRDWIILGWFLLPLTAVFLLKPALYDGWRQLFFIYPAMIMMALVGFQYLWNAIKQNIGKGILLGILGINLTLTAWFMIQNHPYQNVYFNNLAGKDMAIVKSRFDLDYWGLSYRRALEYILAHDPSDKIKVYVANIPGHTNQWILDSKQASRLEYVERMDEAKYFLSNYRGHKEEYDLKNEFFAVHVQGAKIMVVDRLH